MAQDRREQLARHRQFRELEDHVAVNSRRRLLPVIDGYRDRDIPKFFHSQVGVQFDNAVRPRPA